MASFAEGLTLSKQAGLSQEDFIEVINWSWKHSSNLLMMCWVDTVSLCTTELDFCILRLISFDLTGVWPWFHSGANVRT